MNSGLNLWISHRRLLRRVMFKGILEAKSPLRIGAEKKDRLESTVDLAVLRYSSGEPYIPGSSLKGVFRSTGERIAKLKGVETCTGLNNQTCPEKYEVNGVVLIKWLKKKREEVRHGGDYLAIYDLILNNLFEKTCINCKLFGAPSVLGMVRFFDASPIKYSIGVRTGIAIDRTTGATAKRYEVEYVEPGSVFSFIVSGMNLPNYAVGYLASIIDEINSGAVRIGGFKSRGFGRVEIRVEELVLEDYSGDKNVLAGLDKFDLEINVAPGTYRGGDVSFVLEKFKDVWRGVKIGYPVKG